MADKYNYYLEDTYITNSIYEPYRSGQSFITFVSYTITSFKMFGNRRGNPGDVTVSLYATDVDGKPTGEALSTGIIAEGDLADSTDDTGCAWVIASMSSYTLTATTKYAIVLRIAAGDTLNKARFMYDDGSPNPTPPGGTFLTWNGSAWTTFSTLAGLFEVHGSPNPSASTVTTQDISDIVEATAVGNGNITDLGSFPVTQHGVCWNDSGSPTTSDSKTQEDAAVATGAFTTNMTELVKGTKYYVKAYAINDVGTSYGAEVNFVAGYEIFPSDAITRVTSLIHRYDRGTYTLEMGLGEVVADFGLPEWESKPRAGVPEPSFQEQMERTARQLEEEAGMSREESLRIARKLETMEARAREEQRARPPSVTPKPPVTPEEEAQIIKDIGLRLWNKLKGQQ